MEALLVPLSILNKIEFFFYCEQVEPMKVDVNDLSLLLKQATVLPTSNGTKANNTDGGNGGISTTASPKNVYDDLAAALDNIKPNDPTDAQDVVSTILFRQSILESVKNVRVKKITNPQ